MNLLVVGLGSIGFRHAENASALSGVHTAVFDSAPGLAERVGIRLGLPYFSDRQAAFEWGPEAAIVAVPTNLHLRVALGLIEAGAHVLLEKPIAERLEGVDEFLETAENLARKVYVVCNMRFHPAIRAIRGLLPDVGRPLFVRAHYGNYLPDMRADADYRRLYCAQREMGGGVILDAIHEVDYLSWFFGPVEALACEAGKLSDLEINVEDYACLLIRHAGGVRSEVHLDFLRRFKRRGMEVVGSEGSLIWLSEGKTPERCSVRLYTTKRGWMTILEDPALDASSMYMKLLETFLDAVRGGDDQALLNGRTARAELAAVLSAHRSRIEERLIYMRNGGSK